jgi:predicted phage baseplate assembly protein
MIFACCNETRRNTILSNAGVTLNGIDYVEVLDAPPVASVAAPQQTLMLHCLRAVPALTTDNVLIEGGESITRVSVVSVAPAGAGSNVLAVVTSAGDFSPYVLRLVASAQRAIANPFEVTDVLAGFDPQLAEVQFSFHPGVQPGFECAPPPVNCPSPQSTPPPIDYLAKDYGSFRTLVLDRLNQLLPASVGNNEADLGVMLAELIAYRADQLSYQQDAIATEAYLQTARSRVSLRRHARLVGYHVHDGCNARAWMQISVAATPHEAVFLDRTLTRFYTYAAGMPTTLAVDAGNEEAALAAGVQVFQPLQDALLYAEHNLIPFYTWGDSQCCLPAGAVEATLQGDLPYLQAGDVLIFQEVIGPRTGNAADADLRHRCAVRLTQVAHVDAAGQPLVDPLFDASEVPITSSAQTPMPVTQIQWGPADALPFALCISSLYLDSNGIERSAANVSVALGNVVLADHGLSVSGTDLGIMPPPRLFYPPSPQADRCRQPAAPVPLPVRFRPALSESPLTQAVPQPVTGIPTSAGAAMLGSGGTVDLNDAAGFVSLRVQSANPAGWPPLFGVAVRRNATTVTNIDLTVVYDPPGGAAGMSAPVAVEQFANLSFQPADSNYVAAQINAFSNFIRVPSTYTPPTAALSGFPATPTMLTAGQTVTLTDLGSPGVAYLVLRPTAPQGWPASVGVLVQGLDTSPPAFNLTMVYYPASPVGVALPVPLEQFNNLAQATLAPRINAASRLISVQSFAGTPSIALAARNLIQVDPNAAVPQIVLQGTYEGVTTPWSPRQDLLASGPTDPVFVVEIESDGTAFVRFATPGDPAAGAPASPLETNGLVPPSGTAFAASYRIGNGSAGNVGAESLKYLAAADARIQSCRNPLPASGGTDPETNDQIRRRAPQAFLSQAPGTLARSVTMADYEAVAERNAGVNRAVASLRWTGSWYSVFIAVEPQGGGDLGQALQQTVGNAVETCRLAGQDLQLESPQYVSLQIGLSVQVDDNYFRSDVEQSLLQVLGNQLLPNGQKGFFYADNFTFGQSVYLSPIYAAARGVAGVASVMATQFQPQGVNTTQYLSTGEIKLGSLQVARMENDPSYPKHGQLTLSMQGGR